MNKIRDYIRKLFTVVERVPAYKMLPAREELIGGQAFMVHRYKLDCPKTLRQHDTFDVVLNVHGEVVFRKTDMIAGKEMTVDTVGITQFTDALGFKKAVGVFIGEAE